MMSEIKCRACGATLRPTGSITSGCWEYQCTGCRDVPEPGYLTREEYTRICEALSPHEAVARKITEGVIVPPPSDVMHWVQLLRDRLDEETRKVVECNAKIVALLRDLDAARAKLSACADDNGNLKHERDELHRMLGERAAKRGRHE